jgi:hypothetical protein
MSDSFSNLFSDSSNSFFNPLSRSDVFGTPLTEAEALSSLRKNPLVYQTFLAFDEPYRTELLRFIMGEESLPVTYDSVFQKIFDPYLHPERVEGLLSSILGQPIHIVEILQREGKSLSVDSSLIIMDIVTQLADGSYLDVEMQKVGYAFPGERTSCYASDLILRQYDRLKKLKGRAFSYQDMKPVHIIVLMETSAGVFRAAAPYYMHRRQVSYDSGVNMAELTEIIYISLDTFRNVVQNVTDNPLHAWLTFLSATNPRTILELIGKYPDFLPMYQEIAAFRTNPEELITMFSEALAIMDRNTERYMVEEAHKEIEELNAEKDRMNAENAKLSDENADLNAEIIQLKAQIQKLQEEVSLLTNNDAFH